MSDTTIGALDIVLSGDDASFLAAMARCEARVAKLTGTTRQFGPAASGSFNQAAAAADRFGHSSVSSVQAASAALREMNGNFTNNIRAVERLIAMSPALSSALKFAFPAFGVAAGIGMAVEGYEKVRSKLDEINGASKRLTDGFNAMHQAAQLENDALSVTNDKLAIEIAKLEKKPQNSLQLSLDEARQSADKLGDSLSKDLQKTNDLISKSKVGFWGGLVTGQATTGDSESLVKDLQGKIDAVRASYQQTIDDAVDVGGASKENIVAIKTAEMVALEKVYADAHAKIKPLLKSMLDDQFDYDRSGGGMGRNQRNNISILSTFDRQASDEEKTIGGSYLEDTQSSKLNDLKANKGDGGEAARKAAEAQMKGWEDTIAKMKIAMEGDHASIVQNELAFWEKMSTASTTYAANRQAVNERLAAASQAYYSMLNRMASDFTKQMKYNADQNAAAMKTLDHAMEEDQREVHRVADAQARLASAMARANDALDEQQIGHDEATGSISRYGAALEMTRLHAKAYQEQIDALRQDQANDDADANLDPDQRKANKTNRQVQIVQLQMEQQRNSLQDQWNAQAASPLGGVGQAFADLIRQAEDLGSTFKNLTSNTIADFNKTLLDVMTTKGYQHHKAWTGLGKGLATNVAGTALKSGEGMVAGMLGLGQLGTKTNPFWQRSADLGGGLRGQIEGGPLPKLLTSQQMNSGGLGSLFGGLAKTLFAGIPGFADGTSGFGGGLALVGEKGPELLNLPGGTAVTPNGKLPNFGGGDVHFHEGAIDARGSTDPAATAAMVRKAIAEAAPQISAQTAKAMKSNTARTRPGARN